MTEAGLDQSRSPKFKGLTHSVLHVRDRHLPMQDATWGFPCCRWRGFAPLASRNIQKYPWGRNVFPFRKLTKGFPSCTKSDLKNGLNSPAQLTPRTLFPKLVDLRMYIVGTEHSHCIASCTDLIRTPRNQHSLSSKVIANASNFLHHHLDHASPSSNPFQGCAPCAHLWTTIVTLSARSQQSTHLASVSSANVRSS